MKIIVQALSVILFTSISLSSFSQNTESEKALRSAKTNETEGWTISNILSITASQVSLTNWVSGGDNSVSLNGRFNGIYNYTNDRYSWDNQVDLGYGILKQSKKEIRKTDDRLELTSKGGRKLKENVSAAILGSFKTQFRPGYSDAENLTLISDLFSPAYLVTAAGIDYKPSDSFTLFLAPITGKMTFVMNDELSQAGAFGVPMGENIRGEFGGYIRLEWKKTLLENVNLQTKLDLFSNYLENPQYVDVSWEVLILMQINKYLSANINTHLIYDRDINIGKDTSGDGVHDDFNPRIQFKELIGLGLTFQLPQKTE